MGSVGQFRTGCRRNNRWVCIGQKVKKQNADYIERLRAISEHDGKPWGRIKTLTNAEHEHEEYFEGNFGGFWALTYASNCFFLETVERLNTESRPKVSAPLSEFYPMFFGRLVQGFRSLCGSQRLALVGYSLTAFTVLRNIFDDAVMTSACMQKITDFYSVEGVVPGVEVNLEGVKALRRKTEWQVRKCFVGPESGLSANTIEHLTSLDKIFDFEVHGARLSMAGMQGWLRGREPLPVVPKFDGKDASMYMNRAAEIGWMVHRLIPLAQPAVAPLAADWSDKWVVIDDSFRVMVESLTTDLGKGIGAAMCEFVNAKFPFNSKSIFPL